MVYPVPFPAGHADLHTHIWLFAAVALGAAGFCFAVCRALASRSEVDRQVAVLQEQQRLARELHDDLAQLVTFLHINLTALERELGSSGDPELSRRVNELLLATEGVYDKIRELICCRRMEGVYGEGFSTALQACAHEFAVLTGIPVRVELPPDDTTRIQGPVSAQLVRIIREALHNIYRHSGARQARISAEVTDIDLIVNVSDNGRGFEPSTVVAPFKHGLQIMRERAELVRGSLCVTTAPGEGTQITVKVPLDQERSKWNNQCESWSLMTTPSSSRG